MYPSISGLLLSLSTSSDPWSTSNEVIFPSSLIHMNKNTMQCSVTRGLEESKQRSKGSIFLPSKM